MAQYTPGADIEVLVDPKEPSQAVIKGHTKPLWRVLAIGLAILAVSGAGPTTALAANNEGSQTVL